MNYFHPFATSNTPAAPSAVAARGKSQSYPGGGDDISEYHPHVGGGQPSLYSPYSPYPPYGGGSGGHSNPYSPYSPYASSVSAYTGGGQPIPYTHYSPYSSHSPYPPMPALGSGQVHNLPGADNWFSPSGVPRQIASIDERVPLASKPTNKYSYQQNDDNYDRDDGIGVSFVAAAADEIVELKKPRSKSKPKASKGRTRGGSRTKKKSGQYTPEDADDGIGVDAEGLVTLKKPTSKTASTTMRRSRAKSSADGFRTPAKPKTKSSASRTSSARAKGTDGFRTPTDLKTPTSAKASSILRTPATDIGPNWTIECVERGDYSKSSHKKKGQYYKYWHSPGGHKFRSKVEVGVFRDALVKLEGTDHEGDEDIAREMAKQALCNKDVNGGLVITDAITNDAIEMAKDGDLASARGHCIIVKRTCLTPGCTRHRKTDGMCRMHYEEEKKKGKSAKKKSTAVASSGRSRSPTPRRSSRTIANDITVMNNENVPPPRRRRSSTLADDSVKPNDENIPPPSRRTSTPFAGDIVELNNENIPPGHGPDAFVGESFELDEDGVPPLPPPHLSPIEDVSVDDQEDSEGKNDEIINEDAGKNGLGAKDNVSKEDDYGGQYFGGDDESFDDGMPLLDDGSPVAKDGGNDIRGNALGDSDFFRLIDSIPNLPKTDDVPIDDITVSSLGSFKEELVNPPSSPPPREIVESSNAKPSPLPKSSPLKEANSVTRTNRLVIEDDAYVETITGPISEYGRHLDWVDEEKNNLGCNRLDWGEVEGTPTPPKRTPTANSFGRMLQQKQSTRRGTRSQSVARRRPSPARGERLDSVLDEVHDGDLTPPPRNHRRRRSTRLSSQMKNYSP